MKKIFSRSKGNVLNYLCFFHRLSLIKTFSLGSIVAAIAMFLSNASTVYAAENFDIIEIVLKSMQDATAAYSQRNRNTILSAYGSNQSAVDRSDGSNLSTANYLTRLNTLKPRKVNSFVGDSNYVNFLTKTLNKSSDRYVANDLAANDDNLSQERSTYVADNLAVNGDNLSQERSTKGKKRSKRSLSSPQSFLDNSVTMQ
ncbi:hypothetical protein, partial [Bartonella koehlerae]